MNDEKNKFINLITKFIRKKIDYKEFENNFLYMFKHYSMTIEEYDILKDIFYEVENIDTDNYIGTNTFINLLNNSVNKLKFV